MGENFAFHYESCIKDSFQSSLSILIAYAWKQNSSMFLFNFIIIDLNFIIFNIVLRFTKRDTQ